MIDTNWLKRYKRQLLRQARQELKLTREMYTLSEAVLLLKISSATLHRHLADSELHISRCYVGPHKQRMLGKDDILAIWMKRHTIYGTLAS